MSQRLLIGIVGAGLITTRVHLPAVLACANAGFAALVDTSAERTRVLAGRFGQAPRIATAVDDVLVAVDAVIIATPNASHRYLAVRCLERGLHVLLEKPLATSVVEAEAIAAAARKAGNVAAVGYDRRFLRAVQLRRSRSRITMSASSIVFADQFGTVDGWAPVSGQNFDRESAGAAFSPSRAATFWIAWSTGSDCRASAPASMICSGGRRRRQSVSFAIAKPA